MSQAFLCALGIVLSLLASPSFATGPQQVPTPQDAFLQLRNLATNNPFVSNWWMNQRTFLIRDRLDREVFAILMADPLAQQIMDQSRIEMVNEVQLDRVKNLSSMALAKPGDTPHGKILKMIVDVARDEGFPQTALDNAFVFIQQASDLNAYTYSSLRSQSLDVVFYTPLIEGMTESEVRAVAGHELGHQMSEHVLMSVTLTAIFIKTGKSLLPAEEKFTLQGLLKSHLKDALRSLVGPTAIADVPDKTVDWYFDLADRVASQIPDNALTAARLTEVTDKILAASGSKTHDLTQAGLRNAAQAASFDIQPKAGAVKSGAADDGAGGAPSAKEIKNFQKTLTRFTRSQEATADRHAIVFVGKEPLKQSMAYLTGGRNADPEAIWGQVREQTLMMERFGMDADDLDVADHPLTPYRVGSADLFMASDDYKILKDPFLSLLDMTVKATRYAAYLQSNVKAGSGLGWREQNALRRDEYIKIAALGSRLVASIVIDDVAKANTAQEPLAQFTKLINYFKANANRDKGEYTTTFASLPEQNATQDAVELVKKDRLGDLLISGLVELGNDNKSGAPYVRALNMLKSGIFTNSDSNAAQVLELKNIVLAAKGREPETGHTSSATKPGGKKARSCSEDLSSPKGDKKPGEP